MLKKINRYYPEFRKVMKAGKFKYSDIAHVLHRSTPYVANIMRGTVSPRLDECYIMLNLVGVSPDRIFEFFPDDPLSTDYIKSQRKQEDLHGKTFTAISQRVEEISNMLKALDRGQ